MSISRAIHARSWTTTRRIALAAGLCVGPFARAQQLPLDTAGQGSVATAGAMQRTLIIDDPGPGLAGPTLESVIGRPHLLLVAPDTGLTLGRAVRVPRTLVVTHGPLRIASQVDGDVLVLGDLFLRPGANITGRVIAIGGGVYNSTLAFVGGDVLAYRDLQIRRRVEGTQVAVALAGAPRQFVPRVTLPGLYGLRLPAYDRIDGLSLTFSPVLALDTGRVRIEPFVTYRSHLGAYDPGVRGRAELGSRTVIDAAVERGTFTNDAWIRPDLTNSLSMLGGGQDVRNYYRATRVEGTVSRRFDLGASILEPYLGALTESASSVARDTGSTSYPWSLLSRTSLEGPRRANPAVTGGRITSALVGAQLRFERPGLSGHVGARVEQALSVDRGARFTQIVLDGVLSRPTENDHLLTLLAHGVITTGGREVPSQRYAYLGGSGTLPTLFLLKQGGTELAWAEARYTIPVSLIPVPFGVPRLTGRVIAGSAGVNTLPALTPNLGLRAAISLLRVDYVFDPRGRGRQVFSVGVGYR